MSGVLSSIWNFCKRHKRKLIVTGVVVGGGWALLKYAQRFVRKMKEEEDTEYMIFVRKQHHFESNQGTCNLTVMSMVPTIRESILHHLNSEHLREELKSNPANKVEIWEELKVLCFAECLSAAYGCSILALLLRVQLNVIGGFLYVSTANGRVRAPQGADETKNSKSIQERYLNLIKHFVGPGFAELMNFIRQAVAKEVGSIPLKELMSLEQVHAVVKAIRQRVECGQLGMEEHIPTMPLAQYMLPGEQIPDIEIVSKEERQFDHLVRVTRDIIESGDFHSVLHVSLERGFARLLDNLADHYNSLAVRQPSPCSLHEVRIAVAKLTPVLEGLMHRLCCDTPNPFIQELLLLEDMKNFSANIYESFAQEK